MKTSRMNLRNTAVFGGEAPGSRRSKNPFAQPVFGNQHRANSSAAGRRMKVLTPALERKIQARIESRTKELQLTRPQMLKNLDAILKAKLPNARLAGDLAAKIMGLGAREEEFALAEKIIADAEVRHKFKIQK